MQPSEVLEIATEYGPARAHHHPADGAWAGLVIGHGAGGGPDAPDLVAATCAAHMAGVSVVRTEQPYQVAGRRAPAPAKQLDSAWQQITAALAGGWFAGLPLLVGGRSSGARVACRTADDVAATAVICLAFPVHPAGQADDPTRSRMPELDGVTVPVLVVQGESDPFGIPPGAPGRTVARLPGNHSLTRDIPGLRDAVGAWLGGLKPGVR